MAKAKVTSKGQITIPLEVREKLRIDTGHILEFTLQSDGSFVITPVNIRAVDLDGILASATSKKATLEEIEVAVKNRLSKVAGKSKP